VQINSPCKLQSRPLDPHLRGVRRDSGRENLQKWEGVRRSWFAHDIFPFISCCKSTVFIIVRPSIERGRLGPSELMGLSRFAFS